MHLSKVMTNHLFFYLTWCLIVGLGGGEKGDSTALLLLQMFKHASKQVKFVDGKHKMRNRSTISKNAQRTVDQVRRGATAMLLDFLTQPNNFANLNILAFWE